MPIKTKQMDTNNSHKKLNCLALILFMLSAFISVVNAQKTILPIKLNGQHLASEWQLNGQVPATVFLESGFPKVVMNAHYIWKNAEQLHLQITEAPANMKIALWGGKHTFPVTHLIKDSLSINGMRIYTEALVVDFTPIKAWKNYDLIYPIIHLPGRIEINIQAQYLKIWSYNTPVPSDFKTFKTQYDPQTNGLAIHTQLRACDTLGKHETLRGKFLLDLGAANAFILNKNHPRVEKFVRQCDRMCIKDPKKINSKGKNDLSVIMPHHIQIDQFNLQNQFIAALRFRFSKNASKYLGSIGNGFFNTSIVQFDFSNKRFYLKPQSNTISQLN